MVDILFWQTTGYRDSIITSLQVTSSLKKNGMEVAVLFDMAAIPALAKKEFKSSPSLAP